MQLVSIESVITHLRAFPEDYPEGSPERDYLNQLILSASMFFCKQTENKYVSNEEALEAYQKLIDANEAEFDRVKLLTEDVKIALLMLIEHWHKNSSGTSTDRVYNVPYTIKAIIDQERGVSL